MITPNRPAWRHHRPAPRKAAGSPPSIMDTVTWTRILDPRERYRITYTDRNGEVSIRNVELVKVGHDGPTNYIGVMHEGRFKTLRLDRVTGVEQLSSGHAQSIRPQPTYATKLPDFPLPGAVYKMPTTRGTGRTWTVDLNTYTCTCPEKRIRLGLGYEQGRLGFVCPHMARAILDYLPPDSPGWDAELMTFLADPRKIHVDNLT